MGNFKLNKLDDKTMITIGVLSVVLGISVLSYNYLSGKKDKVFEEINFTLFDDMTDIPSDLPVDEPTNPDQIENPDPPAEEPSQGEDTPQEEVITPSYYYIGSLEIPKINLKKGFVELDSKYNDVKYNIQVIASSNFPDVDKGNLILAAHSGSSYIGYFNQLYKLSLEDIAIIYYNNIKYTYKIVNIYTQPKTGKIAIYRDYDKTTLTLVTCTNTDSTTQTVYIAELIGKE